MEILLVRIILLIKIYSLVLTPCILLWFCVIIVLIWYLLEFNWLSWETEAFAMTTWSGDQKKCQNILPKMKSKVAIAR